MLAILFLGMFFAIVMGAWHQTRSVFFVLTVVSASGWLTLSYIALLLMIRRFRERRKDAANSWRLFTRLPSVGHLEQTGQGQLEARQERSAISAVVRDHNKRSI